MRPDELQTNWEKAIAEERQHKKALQDQRTAQERMQDLKNRVRAKCENPRKQLSDYITEQQLQLKIAEENERRRHKVDAMTATGSNHAQRITQQEANGHIMRTGTASDGTTWIWCATCGAYTSERYRSLGAECVGNRNTGQKRRLEGGRHPIRDAPIGVEPRDMTWNDVDAVKLLEECKRIAEEDIELDKASDGEDERARRLYADCESVGLGGHSLVCTGGGFPSRLDAWDYAW